MPRTIPVLPKKEPIVSSQRCISFPRDVLFSDKISTGAKMVYALIYEEFNHGAREYTDTNKQIAKKINRTPTTASKSISELESYGLIKTEMVYGEDGSLLFRKVTI